MRTTQDHLRAKIDELRMAATPVERKEVVAALTDCSEAHSGSTDHSVNLEVHGDALHMCPYSTCGNTKPV